VPARPAHLPAAAPAPGTGPLARLLRGAPAQGAGRLPRDRWRPREAAFWLAPVLWTLALPGYRLLASQVFITGLFALSLDLVLGTAGIASLGHAAFFGAGAYTAGLLAVHGWGEPITGLAAAAAAAALLAWASAFLVVRASGLGRLMVTLGIGLLLHEAANRAAPVTGGVDGLSGVRMWPLLGRFGFDLMGSTACAYALVVLFLAFAALRRLAASPFGLSLRAARENPARAAALGGPVPQRLRAAFTIGGALAGLAGGLLAQTTQFVGLDFLSFSRSADLLVMVVLGGVGRPYGALVGATLFMLAQDRLSGLDPTYWQLWLGLLLVAVVLFARGGVLGGLDALVRRLRRRASPAAPRAEGERVAISAPAAPRAEPARAPPPAGAAALRTERLCRSFGDLRAVSEVALTIPAGARHALIGPNGAGKSTLVHLLGGDLAPSAGEIWLGDERITRLPQHARARLGLARTYQVSSLFPGLTALEAVVLAVCERKGIAAAWGHPAASLAEEADEARALLETLHLEGEAGAPARLLPYGKQRLLDLALALALRPRFLLLDEPAAGVPSGEAGELFEVLARLPAEMAVLFIEHDMELVFRFASRITVLVAGQVLIEGTPAEVARDRRVREVYLGEAQRA